MHPRGIALVLLMLGALRAHAQQAPAPAVSVDPGAGRRPVVQLNGILADAELEKAVQSGLPLHVRVRVELWRDQLFDQFKSSQTWDAVLSFQPLEKQFLVQTRGSTPTTQRLPSYQAARAALEIERAWSLRPASSGRYYYTATIEVATLALSDLEELERWLSGELKPAVSGERSVPGAIGEGAKRLLIRVLALPTRTFELRTEKFRYSRG